MAQGKGFDYYRNSYTHEELWEMLVAQGDSWSVQQAGSLWSTAKGGLERAREELGPNVLTLRAEWTGDAADEFERRMSKVEEYSIEAEESLQRAADVIIPNIASALETAQSNARDQDLYPIYNYEIYDDWVDEVKGLTPGSEEEKEKRSQLEVEHRKYVSDRHDAMATLVANLGDKYAQHRTELEDPPSPPPSDMPGNSTYQPPTGGVFSEGGLNNHGGSGGGIGSTGSGGGFGGTGGSASADGLNSFVTDDLDPVDAWSPGSYDDVDSELNGGLASGSTMIPGGSSFGGSTVTAGGMGGTSVAGAGAGLFGPSSGSGTGSSSGRGTTGNSPARSGATKSGSSSGKGSGGGRGTGSNSSGRGASSRGGMNRGNGPRGGTRSGYSDDDDEEETTRETWLREDDVNWGSNRVPDEELDD